jgi:hypothetical protein
MRRLVVGTMLVGGLLLAAPAAQAQFAIGDWRAQVYDSNATTEAQEIDANVFDQAGGHPYIGVTDFSLAGTATDNVSSVRVDVPAGLVPNPELTPHCSLTQLGTNLCPTSSQIGTEQLTITIGSLGVDATLKVPLYNIEIEDDQVARFGFNPGDATGVPGLGGALAALGLQPVEIVGGVRDSLAEANPSGAGPNQLPADNGLFFRIDDTPATPSVLRSKLTFWGTPGDPGHSTEVGQSCITVAAVPTCIARAPIGPSADADLPFLANPTACTGTKQSTRLIAVSHGGTSDSAITQTPTIAGQEGTRNCQLVPFSADFAVLPDTTRPDAPSGPAVRLRVPQEGLSDTDVLATSHVEDVAVTLPPGMTINPSAANGLAACSDEQFAVQPGVAGGEACPEASRIGAVAVKSPLLPPLPGEPAGGPGQRGSAYVGQPLPGDMYRLFLTIQGRGVAIRMKGSIEPDPDTGQLTASFADNPQLPFGELTVDFRDGPRAPLATPLECGAKSGTARLAPWSGTPAAAPSSAPFEISGDGCPAGFQPTFGAAPTSLLAGAFTPFGVRVGRDDRNQFLSGVRVDAPPGLAARTKGVAKCAGAAASSGACPAASRIGVVTTVAGAGSEPYALSGPVFFSEGYKGAPFGMVAVIRAIAGPYDLGTVVVRQAIFVDPEDASVTVVSDPLPQILAGVPIRLRDVGVTLDRQGFTYNPTSCGAKSVGGRLHSTQGTTADRAAEIVFGDCARLGFAPSMRMQLTGPKQMRQGKHPGLDVRVTQPTSQANIASAVVKLPKSLALDPNNAQAICGFEAGVEADCPAKARIGTAIARSPVLEDALSGPVYFVQGIRIDPSTGARIRTLPSLLAKLNGEIRINLRGTTSVEGGKLVSTFASVPDAPVTQFDMSLKGGSGGVLAATGRPAICGRRQIGVDKLTGHNGKVAAQQRVDMVKPCKRPNLRIERLRRVGGSLAVGGTIAKAARGRITVSARCGKTRIAKRAKRPRKGRWAAALRLRGACAGADRAKVRIAYVGGGAYRATLRKRNVNLPGGS